MKKPTTAPAKCPKHPRYQAIRKPAVKCAACEAMYKAALMARTS